MDGVVCVVTHFCRRGDFRLVMGGGSVVLLVLRYTGQFLMELVFVRVLT